MWVLKERGLTIKVEGEKPSLTGNTDLATKDLIADLEFWRGTIVDKHLNSDPIVYPIECPDWREFLLKPWLPKMMVGQASPPFRKWVPYDSLVCPQDKPIQMTLMARPKPHVQGGVSVSGGRFYDWAMGWRWINETEWRPMPKVKHA